LSGQRSRADQYHRVSGRAGSGAAHRDERSPGHTPPPTPRPTPTAEASLPARSAPEPAAGNEQERLLGALRDTNWNVSRAAARLGISRNTIRYRIEKYG